MVDRCCRCAGGAVVVLLALACAPARADDFEKALLRKFEQQNQKGSSRVKADVEKNLARAFALSPAEPEKALALLRQTRELLDGDPQLPRAERDVLARQLDDAFRDAKARLESKQQLLMTTSPPTEPTVAPGVTFAPNFAPVPFSGTATVTPI